MIILKNKIVGSALIISGTCIGAGMLALPVATAYAGFLYSSIFLIVCWFAMFLTGLYVLEVNLALPEGANFISMAKKTLGRGGEIVAWVTYLLLLYSLMAAYLSGGGALVISALQRELNWAISHWIGPIPWVVVVGTIVYLGVRHVDGFNRGLMLGLVIAYFALVAFTTQHVEATYLFETHDLNILFAALPVAIASFGYHVVVPSLRSYLKGNSRQLFKVIFLGSSLPLLVYISWDFEVFGTIPIKGYYSLQAVLESGQPATHLTNALALLLQNPWVTWAASLFIFFAIASSYLGISFALADFLADGFHIPKTLKGRALIVTLAFIPPLIYVFLFPKGFIVAISYAGVFVAILHGILPALMVWVARRRGLIKGYKAPGGFIAILAILVFSLVVIAAQLVS